MSTEAGFIGVGAMGLPMAINLIDAGVKLRVHNRTASKAEPLVAKGATLAEIMEFSGWQAHTIRGFVSILGSKGGLKIESSKSDAGERTYRIAK